MKEVVKKIMEAENATRERIDEARAEAQKRVRAAEAKSREIIEEAKQKAVTEGQQLVETLTKEAEEERASKVAKVSGGSPEVLEKHSAEIERAVRRVCGLVTGKEQ